MELTSVESTPPSTFSSASVDGSSENVTDLDHQTENLVPSLPNHGDEEPEQEITEEEVKSILEVSSTTGKFWHDWEMLKGLLSFRLKQVLGEYPESRMDVGQQQSFLLGETYPELIKRLDEALLSFEEGPPFTLQRLCEILLAPRSIYPRLSKLALALEKNLLVTSTLTMSTDPYASTAIQEAVVPEKESEGAQIHTNLTQNGANNMAGDGDEDMVDAEPKPDDATKTPEIETKVENTSEKQNKIEEETVTETSAATTVPTPISSPATETTVSSPPTEPAGAVSEEQTS